MQLKGTTIDSVLSQTKNYTYYVSMWNSPFGISSSQYMFEMDNNEQLIIEESENAPETWDMHIYIKEEKDQLRHKKSKFDIEEKEISKTLDEMLTM